MIHFFVGSWNLNFVNLFLKLGTATNRDFATKLSDHFCKTTLKRSINIYIAVNPI
ncbi:hypothetical protein LEP1GSC188_1725 [Leptospira weilii serovar Topaz str. LT2116]|uniref:Uncharacterized protein n=1 Tax=Leptospira weilii serovar Topaz str. LT2116 TaxID=1088540 RepID=M3G8P5_9LEPT|nr:hypothetical protein LEP1GSC188_1725 [Leptospira weilii serovar Topaz str. LT2116]